MVSFYLVTHVDPKGGVLYLVLEEICYGTWRAFIEASVLLTVVEVRAIIEGTQSM